MLPIRCFVALTLDGWYAAGVFQGEVLRIRRPHDYNPAAAKALGPTEPSQHMNLALLSVVGGLVDDATAPRISVTGLPAALEEEQVGDASIHLMSGASVPQIISCRVHGCLPQLRIQTGI